MQIFSAHEKYNLSLIANASLLSCYIVSVPLMKAENEMKKIYINLRKRDK